MQLKRRLMVWVLAATGLTAGTTATAWADGPEVSADMGIYSQYVWRAVTQTGNAPAVQGDVGVAMGGVSFGAWFSNAYGASNGQQVEEFDWTLDYSGEAGAIGYSVGAIYYTYQYDGHSNFTEAYVGGSYDGPLAPSLTVYYTVTDTDSGFYKNGDIWIDLGVSQSVDGYDLSGTVSYVNWASDAARASNMYKDGVAAIALGVSKDVDVAGVTMTPSLTVTVPVIGDSSDGNKYIYGTMVDNEFIAGLNFAY
jgi:uncharacterized protein (TIGR02001 family)